MWQILWVLSYTWSYTMCSNLVSSASMVVSDSVYVRGEPGFMWYTQKSALRLYYANWNWGANDDFTWWEWTQAKKRLGGICETFRYYCHILIFVLLPPILSIINGVGIWPISNDWNDRLRNLISGSGWSTLAIRLWWPLPIKCWRLLISQQIPLPKGIYILL